MKKPYDLRHLKELDDADLLKSAKVKYKDVFSNSIPTEHHLSGEVDSDWLDGNQRLIDNSSLEELLILFAMISPRMQVIEGQPELRTDLLREGLFWRAYALNHNRLLYRQSHTTNKYYHKALEKMVVRKLIALFTQGLYSKKEYEPKPEEIFGYSLEIGDVPRYVNDLVVRLKELAPEENVVKIIKRQIITILSVDKNELSIDMQDWVSDYLRYLVPLLQETSVEQQAANKKFIENIMKKAGSSYRINWKNYANLSFESIDLLAPSKEDSYFLNVVLDYLEICTGNLSYSSILVWPLSPRASMHKIASIVADRIENDKTRQRYFNLIQNLNFREISFSYPIAK
jgi:hypothetical protein